MDPTEHNRDILPTRPTALRSTIILVLLLVALQLIIAILVYPLVPDQIPTHWNIDGQVDGYGSKLNLFFMPLLSGGLFFLIRVLTQSGPLPGISGHRPRLPLVERLLVGMVIFFFALQLITIAAALQLPISQMFLFNLLLGLIFIFVGNYLGKVRRNFWIGIRTPWTLANDISWERTHRVGSWLFVVAGFILTGLSFIPALQPGGTVVVLTLLIGGLTFYSYIVYRTATARS